MEKKDRVAFIIATGFGTGYSKFASGTVGSALAVVLWIALREANVFFYWVITAVSVAVAVIFSDRVAKITGDKDPKIVVIDEIACLFIAFYGLPFKLTTLAIAFVIYRILDIIKPFPARRSQKLPGGIGIVADDFIVGIYTLIVMFFIVRYLKL